MIVQSRLDATAAVTAAVESAQEKPKVVVQASAVGYYGDRGDEILTENSPAGRASFPVDVCVRWENAIQGIADATRLVIIRTGVVLSTRGGALPKMLGPFQLFAGGPCGSGKQWFPWIHIEDEVEAIAFLLDNESACGPYNLVAPGPVTNRTFARALGSALNRPSLLPAPASVLGLALGEMSALLLDSQRVVPEKLLSAGYEFKHREVGGSLSNILKHRH